MGTETSYAGKPSDQLPEEAPAEQVLDDVPEAPEGAARESARRHVATLIHRAGKRDRAWQPAGKTSTGGNAQGNGDDDQRR